MLPKRLDYLSTEGGKRYLEHVKKLNLDLLSTV